MSGWIKLHRKLLDWEWYDDTNTVRLFLHLLLTVNYEPKRWHGVDIAVGQKVTSLANLSSETGLSLQQVRSCIAKLKSTGEITSQATNNFTLITVTNWERFQQDNTPDNNRVTNEQQTDNKRITTTKESKNIRRKESIDIPSWLHEGSWNEFVAFRKAINSRMTEHAEKLAIAELDKLRQQGHNPIDVINQSIQRNWKGLFPIKGDDYATTRKPNKPERKDPASTAYDKAQSIIARRNAAWGVTGGTESTDYAASADVCLPENIR